MRVCVNQVVLLTMLMLMQSATQSAPSNAEVQHRNISQFDELTLERTRCYGTCPIYKVRVSGEGQVKYEGIGYVKIIGSATAQLSREQLARVVEAINAVKYFELRDSYASKEDGCASVVTDHPSVITSIAIGGRKKTIRHYYGCAGAATRALTQFESNLDEIIGTARWVGTDVERPKKRE